MCQRQGRSARAVPDIWLVIYIDAIIWAKGFASSEVGWGGVGGDDGGVATGQANVPLRWAR